MQTMFKKFIAMMLTVAVLVVGMIATAVVIAMPVTYWWIWLPSAVISYFVFEPVIGQWKETFHNLLGIDDDKNK
jgi:hypothetical protein